MKKRTHEIRNYEGWTKEDFEEDLFTSTHYQSYLKNFDADSVTKFIKEHAGKKFEVHKEKSSLYEKANYRQTRFLSYAERFLTVILQKKLFNLQCQWRAGLIDLPTIEYTHDFDYYNKTVIDCPFLEPITEAELELGIRFLLEEDDKTEPHFDKWQDYKGFKIWDNEDDPKYISNAENDYSGYYYMTNAEPIPDFYIYYDTHMYTGHWLDLPDKRWEKEKYYLEAIREVNQRKNEIARANKIPEEPRLPSLYSSDRDTFIEEYEDRETRELLKLQKQERQRYTRDELDWNINFLLELRNQGEEIAFVPHDDWYEAIEQTVVQVTRRKTAEMLPYAYQTYMLEFEDEDWETLKAERIARFEYHCDWYRGHITKLWRETMAEGKALRGE